ncbi:HAMP domain-containing histidine kinase [Clostridium botulinum]|uniref:sensor histidine kinase n=1 Tax=Clostridium botulinum TaxID=1491 RepID=UPI0007730280|nr:HAMP domain-containing sensor histidine kinase [Clostridium botulinum]MBN1041761.1 sensor histidine kinase [Clostridium botulinum]NFF82765.1 HAMP domain-containing histidine kinase [Clostridium botulinum]NFH78598.1 HAMP domain-containing histidine kinase [Clostridium botulinum]NFH83273.1 HAMP domain-containing histidine kinase [Clostridium botulinum]NFH89395.1 HAMP domain-containing histidine kinase [Clostridium botulinum]
MKIKISRKLTVSIGSVVIIVSIISILINLFFVGKYYIFEKRKILNSVENQVLTEDTDVLIDDIPKIEQENSVVIVYGDLNDNLNNINETLISNFNSKKVKLNKFWVTEETLNNINNRSINKIYDQGVPKYRMLTKFVKKDSYIFAIGLSIPYIDETISIVNKFNIYLNMLSIIIIIILCAIISKKIINPLEHLKNLSRDISELNFRKEEIHTNDEIEELAISINSMSESLEKAHSEINIKNKRLKELISDISHELKTPLALIKVYSQGLEDGLDDGTYINTIQEQIDEMDYLIEKLLFWAKLENKLRNNSTFDLGKNIKDIIKKYKLILKESDIKLYLNFDENKKYIICADEEDIEVVLNNFITNAIKYTSNNSIEIKLLETLGKVEFFISNGIEDREKYNLNEIWQPFCVLEKSRNKNISGTGLGLSIIKSILEKYNFDFGFNLKGDSIEFYVTFM